MEKNTDFEDEYKNIAVRICKIQVKLGYSDNKLASYLGVTEEHFCKKLKTGKVPFTMDKLITLRDVGFDVNYIFTGEVYEVPTYQNESDSVIKIAQRLFLVLDGESEKSKRESAKTLISTLLDYI